MAYSREVLCNQALAKIRAAPIATFTENSLEARECRRFYALVIAKMLEGPNDWSFAIQRVELASVTNDRSFEWLFAYQLPSNMARAIRVLPDLSALGLAVPIALPGEPYAETWSSVGTDPSMPYEIAGETLYTNAEDAVLEYAISDIMGISVGALVADAIASDLAAMLAVPVKGDSQREQALQQEAEIKWQRAIAEDRNRHPQQSGAYVSEAMAVRHGSLNP